jgi:hypothetical protein
MGELFREREHAGSGELHEKACTTASKRNHSLSLLPQIPLFRKGINFFKKTRLLSLSGDPRGSCGNVLDEMLSSPLNISVRFVFDGV